ncbi:hypothetical protein EC973_008696 [Apophysomyces ossiformis]|uniref:Uncharacterized protein n=1 Tax=Apophysomyces ossiformis TaxID=679940 RepID=A0A8H7BMH0_9FUNG|nr:hypothetical protein EC973_008696 [Apophysomyces ossiformis]
MRTPLGISTLQKRGREVPQPPIPTPPPEDTTARRFSANSNLMNYSIPNQPTFNSNTIGSTVLAVTREIQQATSDTKTRQLENQIEALTLQNVKLQRTNRLLKVDTDNLIKQKTQPLKDAIQELTATNVRLQRANRLLQDELEEKKAEWNRWREDQIIHMRSVGPEYEYLVQTINLLRRQLNGDTTCETTCCYTLKPVDPSSMVMTLPPKSNTQEKGEEDDEAQEEEMEPQHMCRPIIHSSISHGSYAAQLEIRLGELEQTIESLLAEKEQLEQQLNYRDSDMEMLKQELRIKDDIVTHLEQDFIHLESQVSQLQKKPRDSARNSITRNPKRHSQILMDTKRRSLAIKDTQMLEELLLQQYEEDTDLDDDRDTVDTDKDTKMTTPPRSSTPLGLDEDDSMFLTISSYATPGTYTNTHSSTRHTMIVPFSIMTILLGIAAQLRITDDWTLPITLAVLVSGYTGKGTQVKLKPA